ncbi:MAG: dihydrodipicolinate synthase family protein [Reyranellaceae bacterium]
MIAFPQLRHGVVVALPTPFSFGRPDLPALDLHCRRLLQSGPLALAPCGWTGEGSLLTAEEHRQVVATTVAAAGGRVAVIAAATSNSSSAAIALARAAEQAGASAVLALPPFSLSPSADWLTSHFRALHDSVAIPVLLQVGPPHGPQSLPDTMVRRVVELPRIVGIVDSAGDIAQLPRLRRRLGRERLLLSGDDASQADYRRAGGDGCLSVAANIAPAITAALHLACEEGLASEVRWHDQVLGQLYTALALAPQPMVVKRLLCRLGVMGDGLRRPLPPLGSDFERRLDRVLADVLPVERREAQRGRATEGRQAA